MPKCIVRTCRNSNYNVPIGNGISFFHFPSKPSLAERWWAILAGVADRKACSLKRDANTVVCSNHFHQKDKYMRKKRNRLTRNAIPDLNLAPRPTAPSAQVMSAPDSSDDEKAMVIDVPDTFPAPPEYTVCRVCLLSEVKMERVTDAVAEAYWEVTGVKWNKTDKLPQHVCWECAARVRGAATLRRRALAAYHLLRGLENEQGLTLDNVKSIDRSHHLLTSRLTKNHFPSIQYLSKIINNNQIFTKDAKEFDTNLDFKTDKKTAAENTNETRHFADIGNDDKDKTTKEYSANDNDLKNIQENNDTNNVIDGYLTVLDRFFNNNGNKDIDGLNVEKETKELDTDDDSRSNCLVIDAEPLETVIKSDYVSRTEGGMPIDDLISMYNNGGDGDGRLQELNAQYEGATVQVDQGWGGRRAGMAEGEGGGEGAGGEGGEGEPPVKAKRPRPRRHGLRWKWKPRDQQTRGEHSKPKPYDRMDRQLFTITAVNHEEQIAEIQRRKETVRYINAPYKCHLCYRIYTSERQQAAHMRRHDPINGAYECHICKSRQKSPRAIKSHLYGQHSVRISCNQCSFVTTNRFVARNHGKWHAGTVYQCQYCPAHFDQESSYKGHLRKKHVHAHVCPTCGLTYVSVKGLAVHRVKKHSSDDKIPPDGPYCDTCSVRFGSEEAHARHLAMSSRHQSDNEPRNIGLRISDRPEKIPDQPIVTK